jgi:ABC-type Mn2+/Zn2+ transport system permease subunit
MLFFGALLVWRIEDRAQVATETIVGVIFSAALAIGSMLASGENLLVALFGSAGKLTGSEVFFVLAGTFAVITFVVT